MPGSTDIPQGAEFRNANLGEIRDVQGNVHLGDNQYINQSTIDLVLAIHAIRQRTGLSDADARQLDAWITILEKPDGVSHLAKIRYQFTQLKARLDDRRILEREKLKIWLNRHPQREEYSARLRRFCQGKPVLSPLIFCVAGQTDTDGLAESTEMLQQYHFGPLMRLNNQDFIQARRVADSLFLQDDRHVQEAYDRIMRELLNLSIFDIREDFLRVLSEQCANKHIVLRCRVRTWTEEGLQAFFKEWLAAFERESRYPFLLLLEFPDTDFDTLLTLINAQFDDCSVALLPLLGLIQSPDLDDFYDRPINIPGASYYADIFDRNSLTTNDTPLRYKAAVDKLKLK